MQTTENPSFVQLTHVVYLTNGCGEHTGNGTIELTEEHFRKVTFEEGPGVLRTYIGEINGRAYALAVLPQAYEDPVWPDDERFEPRESAQKTAMSIGSQVRIRLDKMFDHGDFDVIVEEGSGYFEVVAAVALDKLTDCLHTRQTFRTAFGEVCEVPSKDAMEIERQLPERLFLMDTGSNGAAPNGCELVLDDVDGGNEERDYYLISVVHGDPEVLDRMARRVRSAWQICNGIDTDRLDAMALRGEAFVKQSEKHQERIEQLQQLAAQAIAAACDLSNGYPERELSVPLDQLKAAASELGVSLDS
ncbi:MAG: hypothetical protein KGZ70_12830 [Hydrogenophaga sp.]|nr:hypothetical protein [Hydrogenophaga sp.]